MSCDHVSQVMCRGPGLNAANILIELTFLSSREDVEMSSDLG